MSRDVVFVTGATGFVGSHVVLKLLERGKRVRVFARRSSNLKNLKGLDVEMVYGDLTDAKSIREAMRGCRQVYHVAADYRLWAPQPAAIYQNNVQGTRNVLEAASQEKVEKIVYTSTVGALGFSQDGSPSTEQTAVTLEDMVGHYKRSKFLAEQEAMAAAKAGFPVVIVNPSTPVGAMDIKPTPTGQMIVDFLNGRMPAYVETGLNLIDVEDVAEGHLLAMETGRVGEKYILGNENLSLKEILEMLSRISGLASPKIRLPRGIALGIACVSTGWGRLTGRTPRVPLEAVRMSKKKMYFDSSKAVKHLGLPQRPVQDALQKAVVWFRQNGYVRRN
ncbi:MAG: NAD-dependent epimerase/dehydratase family protein [Candidatus Omnitrophica bacterium]|nr:NAD-dependent epimerase/dehydratase family protein [Candidatus Omnitrophota bacterium]